MFTRLRARSLSLLGVASCAIARSSAVPGDTLEPLVVNMVAHDGALPSVTVCSAM